MFKIIVIATLLPFIIANPLLRPRFTIPYWGRIVGGDVIGIEKAPHQISLQDGSFHICGGSIIAPDLVLTAAHCTDGSSASRLRIRAGSDRYASGGVVIRVAKIIQHVKFDYSSIDYDYSILKLSEKLEFSDQIQSIALPLQDEKVEDGTECAVSGWGNTQSIQESRDILRSATVPKVNQALCHEAYKSFGGITDRMICAGFPKGGVDACQGQ
jgi:trypsin